MCVIAFQSPQWGSNSKANSSVATTLCAKFQSPQWGSNSKVATAGEQSKVVMRLRFSPLNGEVILKMVLFKSQRN